LIWTLKEHKVNIFTFEGDEAMDGVTQRAVRDVNGRFMPGQSGNPVGKKPGTRNRATLLAEALRDGEGEAAARIVIDKALAGDAVAARFLVDRLTPRPRGRAIALDLPADAGARDVLAASNATVAAMASGEITPDEALTVTRVLDGRLRALRAARSEGMMQKSPSAVPGPSTRAQEGRGEGALRAKNLHRPDRAHPAIAMATGTPEHLSKGLSREGRGALTTQLLHSTCISTSAGSVFAARLGDRSAAFS
jgi:hypothetical protein